jgi:hypothetical protein
MKRRRKKSEFVSHFFLVGLPFSSSSSSTTEKTSYLKNKTKLVKRGNHFIRDYRTRVVKLLF